MRSSKSDDKSYFDEIPVSSSASKITDKEQQPVFGQLSLGNRLGNEMSKAEKMARTQSPRRPTSASSLLATINESASSRIQSDDEQSEPVLGEEQNSLETTDLNGSLVDSDETRRRSGSIDSCSSIPPRAFSCFCIPHRLFRGGNH